MGEGPLLVIAGVVGLLLGFLVGRWLVAIAAAVVALVPIGIFFLVAANDDGSGGANIGLGLVAIFGAVILPPTLACIIGVVVRKVIDALRRRPLLEEQATWGPE